MSHVARKTPAALADLAGQATYLGLQRPELSARFLAAAEDSFAMLCTMPELGSKYAGKINNLAEFRVWRVKGFESHLIFYCVHANEVEVIRVLHAARDIETILRDS